jgi:hypothetical protein
MSQKKRDQQTELKRKAQKKKKVKVVKQVEGFQWLLGSTVSEKVFFEEFFEKKPLVISRKDPLYYTDVFGTDDIRALFEFKENLALKKDLNVCKVVDGVRVDFDAEELTPQEVWDVHDTQGNTLQVFQPQQRCLSLARVLSRLEDTFGSLFGANSYLTPPCSQGLAPHYDDVGMFFFVWNRVWKLIEKKSNNRCFHCAS